MKAICTCQFLDQEILKSVSKENPTMMPGIIETVIIITNFTVSVLK